MLAKMARSAPRSPFGVPRMTAIVRAAKRSCQNAAKAQKSTTVRGSSGESRINCETDGNICRGRLVPSSGGNHEEATMRTPQLSALVFAMLTFSAVAAEPQKLWEASGFKQPESVVFDRAAGAIYVSNVNGDPMKKDGNGFISKLGPDGKVVTIEWVKGLDSPTGLALANGKLYAADVDRIAEIDIAKGEIIQRYEAPGSKFLNDLTADKTGRVYASDMVTNSIWVLDGGKLSLLMQDDALDNPNGLLAEDGRLVVASWGKMAPDFSTKVPGHMKVVDLATKKVSALGDSTPAGNFDGVEPDGKGGYLVTDWVSGGLFQVANRWQADAPPSAREGERRSRRGAGRYHHDPDDDGRHCCGLQSRYALMTGVPAMVSQRTTSQFAQGPKRAKF